MYCAYSLSCTYFKIDCVTRSQVFDFIIFQRQVEVGAVLDSYFQVLLKFCDSNNISLQLTMLGNYLKLQINFSRNSVQCCCEWSFAPSADLAIPDFSSLCLEVNLMLLQRTTHLLSLTFLSSSLFMTLNCSQALFWQYYQISGCIHSISVVSNDLIKSDAIQAFCLKQH